MTNVTEQLFVGNIPFSVGWEELTELFNRAGTVRFVDIPRPQGKPGGFAFVRMASEADNDKAISIFEGYLLHGRQITVRRRISDFQQDKATNEVIPNDPWDEFVKLAKEYGDSGVLQTEEVDYKLQMSKDLAHARSAVLAGTDDWHDRLKYALRTRPGHPIAWTLLSDFNNWCADHSQEALSALQVLWSIDDTSVVERIHAFSDRFPRSAVRGAVGNRANIISVLLMGVNGEQFPPYRVSVFNWAYDGTQYGRPERDADEALVYQHALEFLQCFIDKAEERELKLRHRLDAQSAIWQIYSNSRHTNEQSTIELDDEPEDLAPSPSLQTLADELFLPVEFLENIEMLLHDKRQVIFQGPPGTGKTYVAQKLANHLAGLEPSRRVGGSCHARAIPPVLCLRGFCAGLPSRAGKRSAGL